MSRNILFTNILEYPIKIRVAIHFFFGFILNLPCSMVIHIVNDNSDNLTTFIIAPILSGLSFTFPLIHLTARTNRTVKRILSSFIFGSAYGTLALYQFFLLTGFRNVICFQNILIATLFFMLIPWGILIKGKEFPFDILSKKR